MENCDSGKQFMGKQAEHRSRREVDHKRTDRQQTTAGMGENHVRSAMDSRDTHSGVTEPFKDSLDSLSGALQGCAERPFLNPAVVPFLCEFRLLT